MFDGTTWQFFHDGEKGEHGLAFDGMFRFRNKLIQQGRYTDPVDELLIKLQKARRCRHG
jgi:hypothetical protein